ncbi:hypothetical protein [Urbifossiella limnaea]|uniref:Uncharacterized protein n=1 Tax=Urbifossiella limnaea TaxID=2528023 RepID=A0A517XNN9_9BACT|nr:hypothetical protein [Urbifossiella limnaea]QDU19124.1 hypothetical protein ETAA1_10280 [Urbifossiella limnaea]
MPRWLKKTLVGGAVTVVVLVLVVVIARASLRRMGTRELERVTARIDADDAGWRLDAILAARARAAPPPKRNPAEAARRVREGFTPEWQHVRTLRDFGGGYVTNEWPGLWATAWFLQARPVTAEARTAARAAFLRPDLADHGYVALTVPDNPYMTLLPHAQNTREVFEILEVDAKLAAFEGKPDRGVGSARAGLVACRALGDEPFLISQLVRIAGASIAATAGMQVLAWGEPRDDKELAAFQAALRAEADVPYLLNGLRGERATLDRVFEGLENGTIAPGDFVGMAGGSDGKNPLVAPGFALYKGLLPGDRAMALKLYTEMIDAAKKPPHEQRKALAAVKLPDGDPYRIQYVVTKLTLPAVSKVGDASIRARATLLTASAAVACERFRLSRGRWPESLAEIPADVLPPLPPDPYTGGAIQYQKTDDGGVLVYAAADDQNQGIRVNGPADDDPLRGVGRGWKLWPPAARGATRPAPELPFDDTPDASGGVDP